MSVPTLERWAIVFARIALASAFLSGVADRFGLWPARYGGYGDFAGFVRYTATVNAFMPSWTIPILAWSATIAELTLGLALLVGYQLRRVSLAAAALLFLFGGAMSLSFGVKSPLDYSVFSAAAASILLSVHARRGSDV